MGTSYQAFLCHLLRQRGSAGLKSVATVALLTFGCQASVKASSTRVRADSEETPDFDKPMSAKELATVAPAAAALPDTPLLGARSDFSLVSASASAACACLKVGIGAAQSAAFQWQGRLPQLNEDTQIAFAMTSENMVCKDEPKGSSGASYWGYRISGNDVIVFVEGARDPHPHTNAAIIPKPVGDGQVYVAPATSKLPYGRPLTGKGERCKIGGMPTKRAVPFTQAELGDSSTRNPSRAPTVDGEE